jgi:uncharacterized membrane protein YqjE
MKAVMASQRHEAFAGNEGNLAGASTGELVGRLADEAKELVKKEVELAKFELKNDAKSTLKAASGLAVAGVAAFLAVQLLLATLVLALAEEMPGWAAALITTGAVFVVGLIAAVVGWRYWVRDPLRKTRKTLKEDAQWAQERLT